MTEVRCLYGVVYRTPAEAYQALREYENSTTERASIKTCHVGKHYHLKFDGGKVRDVACSTKRMSRSRSHAKKKLKELHRAGRRNIVMYTCWYSEPGEEHYHHGNPPGAQTYKRPGRIYG